MILAMFVWPGLTRPSTRFHLYSDDVDARIKSGHDERELTPLIQP